jgi:hypothetical protein
LATGLALMITQGLSGPFLITILIMIPIGTIFLLLAIFFPTMRYEIEGSRLTLRYGPLLRYTIELGQIKSIRSRDLEISPLSSFRFICFYPHKFSGKIKLTIQYDRHFCVERTLPKELSLIV